MDNLQLRLLDGLVAGTATLMTLMTLVVIVKSVSNDGTSCVNPHHLAALASFQLSRVQS
jgi:hypothetical protein